MATAKQDDAIRYVALLRGINVGGHRLIKMSELAKMFERMEFTDVKTLIASGNVVFSSPERNREHVTARIESALQAELGYAVRVILRTVEQLKELVAKEPFADVDDPDTSRYVVFYPELQEFTPELPIVNEAERYAIRELHGTDVLVTSALLAPGRRGDWDKFLAKNFGKISTARNWNTVVKLAGM